jgi:hypothetical protein
MGDQPRAVGLTLAGLANIEDRRAAVMRMVSLAMRMPGFDLTPCC